MWEGIANGTDNDRTGWSVFYEAVGHGWIDPEMTAKALFPDDVEEEEEAMSYADWKAKKDASETETDPGEEPADDPIHDMGGPKSESKAKPKIDIDMTPYAWEDGSKIPEQDWLIGTTYAREIVSGIIAPGGGKKTALMVIHALMAATGKNLLGEKPGDERPRQGPLKVWYVNLEDPTVELRRRFAPACKHYGITKEEIGDRLFIHGRELSIVIAEEGKNCFNICVPVVDAVKKAIGDNQIDLMLVDPFVSSHAVSENDNMRIDAVVKQWAKISGDMKCGLGIAHHIRKGKPGQLGFDADDARGASAFVDACRKVVTLNGMTTAEAEKYQIEAKDRYRYFRYGEGKENNSPPSDLAVWRKLESVHLDNAVKFGGDNRQVVTAWEPTPVTDDVTAEAAETIFAKIKAGEWREDAQSSTWVGTVIGEVLEWDTAPKTEGRASIKTLLATWIKSGVLKVVTRKDAKFKPRKFVVVNIVNGADEIFPEEDENE